MLEREVIDVIFLLFVIISFHKSIGNIFHMLIRKQSTSAHASDSLAGNNDSLCKLKKPGFRFRI